jgi:ATP-dependent exoDNAse (exonuclease V) alpha subunit
MAIYHLSVKSMSRSEGRRSTAAAAYRSAEAIHDEEFDKTYDYSHKRGVEHSEIVLSTDAAKRDIQWARDRTQLWNTVEAAEKRKDARVAREYELALPGEMTRAQRLELTREFAQEIANRYGNAVDFAIHAPHWKGDQRNFHAHLMATTRQIMPTGLGPKTTVEWSNTDRQNHGLPSASQEMTDIRQRWAALSNEHLARLGHESKIDHRSLEAQGIEREPTVHLGPAVSGMERRGIRTEVGFRVQEEAREGLERAYEIGRLERQSQANSAAILVLDSDIKAALVARETGAVTLESTQPKREPDRASPATTESLNLERKLAQDRWLEFRRNYEREEAGKAATGRQAGQSIGWERDDKFGERDGRRRDRRGLEDDFGL